jgi:ABC-type sugar transport system ATPase subunit
VPALLQTSELSKAFFGVHALRSVSLDVEEGGILGLVGENGAGKSTLMNIIGGVVQPTEGSITLAGAPYAPRTPAEATAAGIAFIHQELNLSPTSPSPRTSSSTVFRAVSGLSTAARCEGAPPSF